MWVTFKDVCVSVEKSGVYIYKKSVAIYGVYPSFQSQIPLIYRHLLLTITYCYWNTKKVMVIYKENLKPYTYAFKINVVAVNGY